MLLLILASLITLLALYEVWHMLHSLAALPTLPAAPALPPERPLVSLLIPARNESATIARCLHGALSQRYAPCEVIVVNDHSTDSTPSILARYAETHPAMRVIEGSPLPAGWTGKAHACQQAAAAAQGEWLVFLDADTMPQPDLVAALLAHAHQQQCVALSTFPRLELGSFWERVLLPPFRAIIWATFPLARANAPDARTSEIVGNGQCFAVQRAAYEAIGGHAAVRSDVLEDMMLARALHTAGARVGVAVDTHHLRVRMYTRGAEVVEGLTKNAVAGYRSGGLRSFWAGTRLFFLALAPVWLLLLAVGLAMSSPAGAAATVLAALVVALAAGYSWGAMLHNLYDLPRWWGALWSFGVCCYGALVLRSWWLVCSGRGVTWKGRTYAGTH